MAELDNESLDKFGIIPTPDNFDFEVDSTMEDHDMLLHHVVQHDHELYAVDSSLSELLGV